MNGYTRVDIIKKLKENRIIEDKFQTEKQFLDWCNTNLTRIKQSKGINPINTEDMKYINEKWKDKEYYSSQDAGIMYQELLAKFDELDDVEQIVNTNEIKNALINCGIELINPSARISTVTKELKIKPVKKGRPSYYTITDAKRIVDKIKVSYRGIKEDTDEDRAIEEIKKMYKERDDLKIENARLMTENEKLKSQIIEQQETITRQQGTIARLENKHTSNKLIDMILGRNRGEAV